MAVYTIDILASGIEQGTITSSGDVADSQCVRCIGYLPFKGTEDGKIQMSATATTGKTVQVDLLGYTSNTTTSPSFDLYWYDSPKEFDISSYSDVKYLRIVLKYADGSTLIPSEVASCIITYEYVYSWEMEGDYPVPTKSLQAITDKFVKPYPASLWQYEGGDTPINGLMLPILQEHFTKPYPASLWSIDESNGGLPYTELMPDILYVERKGGAFEGAENLEQVKIPPSVKEIGEKAFADTALTEVTIAEDCTYYGTSFPQDCVINIYPE